MEPQEGGLLWRSLRWRDGTRCARASRALCAQVLTVAPLYLRASALPVCRAPPAQLQRPHQRRKTALTWRNHLSKQGQVCCCMHAAAHPTNATAKPAAECLLLLLLLLLHHAALLPHGPQHSDTRECLMTASLMAQGCTFGATAACASAQYASSATSPLPSACCLLSLAPIHHLPHRE